MFQDRVIAQDHPTDWPPRSPDLTLCDFCDFWGFVKGNILTTPTCINRRYERSDC